MFRLRLFVLASVLVLLGSQAMASNFAVGTCLPGLPSYPTISAAVGSVPPFSTVLVCPGTYPEQVTIAQPLTVKGVASGNSSRASITVPSGGLITGPPSVLFGISVTAQVTVDASPVNLTNLTVNGSGYNDGCASYSTGIYYASGSGGTVNEVTTLNQLNSGCGFGIIGENGGGAGQLLTIQNSTVRNYDATGVLVGSNQSPASLTANIKGNYIPGGFNGIFDTNTAGIISGNVSTGNTQANIVVESSKTVSANTLTDSPNWGIVSTSPGTFIASNKLERNNTGVGLYFGSQSQTVQLNSISASAVAIEFYCTTGNTVSKNTITDAGIGIDQVPSGFVGSNSYFNVDTIRQGGCGFASTHPSMPKVTRNQ